MTSASNRTAPAHSFRSALGAALLTTSTLAGASLVLASPAAAQTVRSYEIPAGSLADAINSFAEQSGAQILYDAALTEGRRSPGLRGRFGIAEGLSRLLSGSGATFRQSGANVYTLEAAPQSAGDAIQLGPVRVEGGVGAEGRPVPPPTVANIIQAEGAASDGYRVRTLTNVGPLGAMEIADTPYSVSVTPRALSKGRTGERRKREAPPRIDDSVRLWLR